MQETYSDEPLDKSQGKIINLHSISQNQNMMPVWMVICYLLLIQARVQGD
jgi:hypothetical protein